MTVKIGGGEKDVCYAMFIDIQALHGKCVLIGSLDEGTLFTKGLWEFPAFASFL